LPDEVIPWPTRGLLTLRVYSAIGLERASSPRNDTLFFDLSSYFVKAVGSPQVKKCSKMVQTPGRPLLASSGG